MRNKEEKCKNVGVDVFGDKYELPAEETENISRKLKMIRNTTLKVKTAANTTNTDTGVGSTGSIVSDGADMYHPPP